MPPATANKTRKTPKRRRSSTAAQRKFEKTFRPIVERMVNDAIEDRLDAIDGVEALREKGEVAHDAFWKKRGL